MGGIHIKNKWLPYVLVAPTVVLICVFKIYPIIISVVQAFLSKDGAVTLDNYKFLFADKTFWNSLKVTLKFNHDDYSDTDYRFLYYGNAGEYAY